MCEPWAPVVKASVRRSGAVEADPDRLLAARVAAARPRRAPPRPRAGGGRRRAATPPAPGRRTARRSPPPTPGCRAGRTRRSSRRGFRTRSACRAAGPRSRTPRSTPRAASAGLTWSCGPTDTPPEMITTSERSSAAAMPASVAARSSGSRWAAAVDAPAPAASPVSIGALELWISPGPSGSPGARSSSPVHRTLTRGRWATRQRPDAGGDGGAELDRAQPGAGGEHGRAGGHVLAGLADVLAGRDRGFGGRARSPSTVTFSCGITASAPGGTAAPVEIRIASPSCELELGRRARARLADDPQPPSLGPGENGIAVHRRAGERRDVAGRPDVLGQHPAERVVDRDLLLRKGANRLEDERASLRHGDQRRRHRHV